MPKEKGGFRYLVKKGDTLSKISKKIYGSNVYYKAIANDPKNRKVILGDGHYIFVGSSIYLPKITIDQGYALKIEQNKIRPQKKGGMEYVVKKGDNLWRIAKKFYGTGEYWTRISADKRNKSVIKNNGKLIIPGTKIYIPVLEVNSGTVEKPVNPGRSTPEYRIDFSQADNKAMDFHTPGMKFKFQAKGHVQIIPLHRSIVVIDVSLKGELIMQRDGTFSLFNYVSNLKALESQYKVAVGSMASDIKAECDLSSGKMAVTYGASNILGEFRVDLLTPGCFIHKAPPHMLKKKRLNHGIYAEGKIFVETSVCIIPFREDPITKYKVTDIAYADLIKKYDLEYLYDPERLAKAIQAQKQRRIVWNAVATLFVIGTYVFTLGALILTTPVSAPVGLTASAAVALFMLGLDKIYENKEVRYRLTI